MSTTAYRQNNGARAYVQRISRLPLAPRITRLKEEMLEETRYLSVEQARIITRVYRESEGEPTHIRRARSLNAALQQMQIRIDPGELIVGNRTAGIRAGVVFPEAGISWLEREIDSLPTREQDRFSVRPEDAELFRTEIAPYWRGRTLEDRIYGAIGEEIAAISRVVKINQKDHAQGHICPNTEEWLRLGPAGIQAAARARADESGDPDRFFESVIIALDGARAFIRRYAGLARAMVAAEDKPAAGGGRPEDGAEELEEIAELCEHLAERPPESFRQALQSVWFLFVILQMESNASSFSPGRMDQYLYPFFRKELQAGTLTLEHALALTGALWLKFNQIVYLRNAASARYFAGFPIGFNVAVGGQTEDGGDASNELSFLFLRAQELVGLPQPNLSARLYRNSPHDLLRACARVIGRGSGMPQLFNDEAVIPALKGVGIAGEDARNYAVVGCVELTTHGNSLGWSDAAMFNMVKVLELTLTGGRCLVDKRPLGEDFGSLRSYASFAELESAFAAQIDHFLQRTISCCDTVDGIHGEVLPSPFLSSVVDDCLARGADVTRGGAHYNLSGIQAIQPANLADSLAAVKQLVFEGRTVSGAELLEAMRTDFHRAEELRQVALHRVPKYGNDVEWVDEMAAKWTRHFAAALTQYVNRRGGRYHTGLYTVSAHVPMGHNVGATPDGRRAGEPLADGGMSAVYGRDVTGPTALLRSVSRIDSRLASNGTLLNMKFGPALFQDENGLESFAALLRTFVKLGIIHVQFNVLNEQDLRDAQARPERYRSLTVRVAGYTAYFTELAGELQQEIIARTTYWGGA